MAGVAALIAAAGVAWIAVAGRRKGRSSQPGPSGDFGMGLARTRAGWLDRLQGLFGPGGLGDEAWRELEEVLVTADIGLEAAHELLERLRQRARRDGLRDFSAFRSALAEEIEAIVRPFALPLNGDPSKKPFVILVVGVNGVGKTTTIGKLARRFKAQGHTLLLAAGDTFRAGAIQQLAVWGERNDVPVIAQQEGSDSAAVVHDALQAAVSRGVDLVIADTAGRLHTKVNLMEEIKKVARVASKAVEGAPHEVLMVVDSTTGQNALHQIKQFHEALGVTGLVMTKLDGTPRGGILVNVARQFGIPIRFVGVGERAEDLIEFDPKAYARALLEG